MAYFEAVEAKSYEVIMDLFDEKCEVFFRILVFLMDVKRLKK
ncbi:hypothetical protein Q0F97_08090 [Tetragenococcus halophilus]|nr:hypothetical protein [Tetragenococcus halophilus]